MCTIRSWTPSRAERVGLTAGLVHRHNRAIVFCRTRHGADRLTRQLRTNGVTAVAIHGNRTQAQRQRALDDFSAGRAQALVATDVAARGIHVDAVPCVVHFDPPADAKDYLHRSGRTGRAGATGTVVTLVSEDQRRAVAEIRRDPRTGRQRRPERTGPEPRRDSARHQARSRRLQAEAATPPRARRHDRAVSAPRRVKGAGAAGAEHRSDPRRARCGDLSEIGSASRSTT